MVAVKVKSIQKNLMIHGALILLGTYFQGFWLGSIQASGDVQSERFIQAIGGHRTGLAMSTWMFCIAVSFKYLGFNVGGFSSFTALVKALGWILYLYNLWCVYIGRVPGRMGLDLTDGDWVKNGTLIVGLMIPIFILIVTFTWLYGFWIHTETGKGKKN